MYKCRIFNSQLSLIKVLFTENWKQNYLVKTLSTVCPYLKSSHKFWPRFGEPAFLAALLYFCKKYFIKFMMPKIVRKQDFLRVILRPFFIDQDLKFN